MKKLIVLLLLCFTVISYSMAENLGELRTKARTLVLDTETDTQLQAYTSSYLNNLFNEAQEDVVDRTWLLKGRDYINTNNYTFEYSISTNSIIPERVCYDTGGSSTTHKYDKLDYTTENGRDKVTSYWENASSACPTHYGYRGNKIYLYPPPSLTYSGTSFLRIDYVLRPEKILEDTDIPFNNEKNMYVFHKCLVYYVCAVIKGKEREKDLSDFYWSKYIKDVETFTNRLNARPDKLGEGFDR